MFTLSYAQTFYIEYFFYSSFLFYHISYFLLYFLKSIDDEKTYIV